MTRHKLELKSRAMAANMEELPHLSSQVARLDELQALLNELTAEQARLTAARREVSRRIAELTDEAQKLMTFLDVAVKQHYGHRSEKLAEFGLQPFRGKPKKRNAPGAEAAAPPENE